MTSSVSRPTRIAPTSPIIWCTNSGFPCAATPSCAGAARGLPLSRSASTQRCLPIAPRARSTARKSRGCARACSARASSSASIVSIIPRASRRGSAPSTSPCGGIRRSSARSGCCRSRRSRAAKSPPTGSCRTRLPARRATLTGATRQPATPSRSETAPYRQLQNELAGLVGDINGRHAEVDWTPIRYLNRGFGQSILAGFFRTARVGLVTPLRDGMNLVAKEYVAAQDPADPGVLVLSQFAGAAKQLDAALQVNPHDIEAMAQAIVTALAMPLDERRERWTAMMKVLEASSLTHWFSTYVAALKATGSGARARDRRNVAWPAFRRLQIEPAASPAY